MWSLTTMFDYRPFILPALKVLVVSALIGAYSLYLYNKGYDSAKTKYEAKFTDAAHTLENLSYRLGSDNAKLEDIVKKIDAIDKTKPTYIIKGTECKPSKDFINSYNRAVEIVNE